MEDIKILNYVMPVIQINFDEMKQYLSDMMARYENIIVTEDTLKGCKEQQKELAGLRRQIDTYRKDKKKAMSEPITAFENQCKELIGIIDAVEKPIKEGIAYFDNQRKAEKKEEAELMASEVVAEIGLNEKYASRLTVIDKYCNLTAKKSEVKQDLMMRAMVLKGEQDKETELRQIMADTLEYENQKIKNKLQLSEFEVMVDRGFSTSEVIARIKKRAEEVYKIENAPAPEPEVAPVDIAPAPSPAPVTEEAAVEQFYAIYRISGTAAQLRSVSEFLRNNGIVYKVEKQGRV